MCETDTQWEAAVQTQEAQPGALWKSRVGRVRGGGSKERGHIYAYGGFIFYGRSQHNIAKQLSSN